jgi:hypothetical protein
MISFSNTGDFSQTLNFLGKASKGITISDLNKYGQEGVEALSRNTPVDSGSTANSWTYKIITEKGKTTIAWYNSNIVNGAPIAVMLQYGHGTKNGGWVQGRDYINPAIRPIFDKMANLAWKEVNKI